MAVIYLCPADKRLLCSWEGYASDIKQHFEKEHNGLLFHTNTVEIDLNILHENRLLYLEEEIYLIQSYIQNNKLYLKLRYLGSHERARKIQYDIAITANNITYKYETERSFSCIIPTDDGWEINLKSLEDFHGKLQHVTSTILIKNNLSESDSKIKRKDSDVSLIINNNFVERNVCDEVEEKYLDSISFAESRIQELKNKRDSDDLMDKISHLNFSILEEPFSGRKISSSDDYYRSENFTEMLLPDIPEELNLACPSCHVDMLPPIYLCVNGHNVCSWCKVDSCKLCNGTITTARNTDLENISRTHKHNCRYASDGCNEKLYYNEVRSHEARCQFCKYKCVINDCNYQGKFEDFLKHLKIVHSSIKLSYVLRNEFPKDVEFHVVHKSIGIFYCKSEQIHDFIIWKATFCGPKERQFFCELSFKGSKIKDAIFMNKGRDNIFEIKKHLQELKNMKAKPKYAVLNITSYDN